MQHFELRFLHAGDTATNELLIALLADAGCNSFMEEDDKLLAYIEAESVDDSLFAKLILFNKLHGINYLGHEAMPEKNWNALWESAYEPVLIDDRCLIRAPFHQPVANIEHDIVIMPRMSFGTAHHETTALMIGLLLEQELANKALLDMGCGTAVLAILARRMGASPVLAIDNDEWAFNNARDNVVLNDTADIEIGFGDVSLIGNKKFDLIIANINRNVLLADIPVYVKAMRNGCLLMLSGFYMADLDLIKQKATETGLDFMLSKTKNDWTAAVFSLGNAY
jgi:ribosomal protein L11 methyltransferase